MSLLLRKPIQISLFPGELHLHGKQLDVTYSYEIDAADPFHQALEVLDSQLAIHQDKFVKYQQAVLLASDHFGVVQVLPWQDHLFKKEEIDQYAKIFLEQQSLEKDTNWTTHAEMISYGQPGIVYGFTDSWVKSLRTICEQHGLMLTQTLPLFAQIFFNAKSVMGKHTQVAFIGETKRVSMIKLQSGHVQGCDVEPVLGNVSDAVKRIVKRSQSASMEPILQITLWASNAALQTDLHRLITEMQPGAKCTLLAADVWRLN